jgi:RNA polymerase sigma-70 factor, ECF subfamily
MQDRDDWEVVALAQAGESTAFTELVQRYQRPILHYCLRMAGSRDDAEELTQETFIRLHRHLGRLEPRAKFSTVLFGIARNLCLNFVRDRERRRLGRVASLDDVQPPTPLAQRPDSQARAGEIGQYIEAALGTLSSAHQEILVLRENHGMDYDSLAQVLGCRKGTVRSRLARARSELRQALIDMGGELL